MERLCGEEAIASGVRHGLGWGDGTHEVVNGCFIDGQARADDLVLSVIPTGTGGDLRRTLGLPNSALEAIDFIGNNLRIVDVGRLDCVGFDGQPVTSHFINISSFGASGLIVQIVNDSSKMLGGKLSFLLGVARGTLKYTNLPMKLTLDPETEDELVLSGRYYNGVVANANVGGGMHIAPDASMEDGYFDVIVLGDLSLFEVIKGTPSIYSGARLNRRDVHHYKARVIRADPVDGCDVSSIWMVSVQKLPGTYTVIPGALRVSVGPEYRG